MNTSRWVHVIISMLVLVWTDARCATETELLLVPGVSRGSLPTALKRSMWVAPGGPFVAEAVVSAQGSPAIYWLYGEGGVGLFDREKGENLASWPLKRWPHQYSSPAVAANYAELSSEYPPPFDYEYVAPGVGCLGETPLRFGDIEGDGQKELVIILNNLFIVFSPKEGRTVFAEYLDESDWLNEQEMQDFYNTFGEETAPTAQYLSRFHADNDGFALAVRAYAKLFFGDFDEDGQRDIIAWRKSYRSNAGTNPTKGFTKIQDNWQHFERQAEEGYLPQETAPDVVRSWLGSADLTWSKGFPNRSECSGQEDQLIPEMHDPLLNDPEVLQ